MKKNLIKIFSIVGIIALTTTTTSCQDAIDITQDGELTLEAAYEDVDDLEQGMNYVYASFSNYYQIALSSIWTDEVGIGFANGGQGLDGEYSFVMNSGSYQASGIWTSNYDLINFSTRILDAASYITPEEGEEERYNDILAQARALRAYAHFDLLTYFSTDLTDDNALGVIILDYVPELTDQLPRSTNGEVFDFINADLDFAEANLASTSTDITYVNQNFITALRARMALYRENYTEARTYAESLISAVPLSSPSEYESIWEDEDGVEGEVLFKLERTTDDTRIASLWQSVDNTITGSSFYEVGRSLFNELDEDDIRYDVLINSTSVIDPDYDTSTDYYNTDILLINKYPGSESLKRLNDLKIFRTSEMYFIVAEAQIASGDLTGAASTLQDLREVRFGSNSAPVQPTYTSETQAWADVLAERRIELAFEGHRWVDLKRLDSKAQAQIDRDDADCAIVGVCTLPIDDYRFTLPIPATEIASNTAIRDQQNPGY